MHKQIQKNKVIEAIRTDTRYSMARNVSMYPDQWSIVDTVDSQYGFRNTSFALRFVMEQYRKLTSGPVKALLLDAAKEGGFASVEDFLASLS